jgi:hypothetical protein
MAEMTPTRVVPSRRRQRRRALGHIVVMRLHGAELYDRSVGVEADPRGAGRGHDRQRTLPAIACATSRASAQAVPARSREPSMIPQQVPTTCPPRQSDPRLTLAHSLSESGYPPWVRRPLALTLLVALGCKPGAPPQPADHPPPADPAADPPAAADPSPAARPPLAAEFPLDGSRIVLPAPIVFDADGAALSPAADPALYHLLDYLGAKESVSLAEADGDEALAGDAADDQPAGDGEGAGLAERLVGGVALDADHQTGRRRLYPRGSRRQRAHRRDQCSPTRPPHRRHARRRRRPARRRPLPLSAPRTRSLGHTHLDRDTRPDVPP